MLKLIIYGDSMSKKNLKLKIILLVIISVLSIIFVYNDYFLYKTSILKVNKVENKIKDSSMFRETYYDQQITGIIKNGQYKGKEYSITNTVAVTGVYGEIIHEGSEIFVEFSNAGEIIEISGVKRDKYLVILFVIFVDLMIINAGKKGVKTLVSFVINVIISALAIFVFQKNLNKINMLLLYLGVSILFIVLSLYITNGKSKKTLSAILSSIASLFVSFGLAFILINVYKEEISIWTLEYIEAVYEYENFFYVTILLCGLGAIMDISITLSSSLNELIEKDPSIKKSALIKSGREISKDIVGTMINVMLYTCYTPIIPIVLLAIKNNVSLSDALSLYGEVDLIAVFCSSISIVLAIPISLYIATFILSPRKKEVNK